VHTDFVLSENILHSEVKVQLLMLLRYMLANWWTCQFTYITVVYRSE